MTTSNLKLKMPAPFPSNVIGVGGLQVQKLNGLWTVGPNFAGLAQIAALPDPTAKEVWVFDPLTNTYNVMTLAALGASLFQDTSATPQTIGAGSFTFTVNPGKAWQVGGWVVAASSANPANYMVGQVTAYATLDGMTSLTMNVLVTGGSGAHSDWDFSLTGEPASTVGLSAIEWIFDGGGQPLIAGMEGWLQLPFGCQILGSTLLADQNGSIVIDVRKSTYAGFPPSSGNSITAADQPALSSAQKSTDSTLTGWTTVINPNDILLWHIVSTSGTVQRVTHIMPIERT